MSLTSLKVEISDDGLEACLSAMEEHPDVPVKIRHLQSYLTSQGVHHGLDPECLERFLEVWKANAVSTDTAFFPICLNMIDSSSYGCCV